MKELLQGSVTTADMVFKKTNIVRGQYLYSFAESVAISVIDAEASLVGVANIKYKERYMPMKNLPHRPK